MEDRFMDGVYMLHAARSELVPAVFDSPHSGLGIPEDWRCLPTPETLWGSGVDNFIDQLFKEVPQYGASFLEALFHRAYVDPNRSDHEIDPVLLDAPWPGPMAESAMTRRGRGVVWRITTPEIPLFDRKLSVAELQGRIDRYWKPYHDTLKEQLDRAHAKFGVVYHFNCHANRAVGTPGGTDAGEIRPEMELGTVDGRTASPDYIRVVKDALEGMGYQVVVDGHNKGEHLVRAYADPLNGRYSMMLEIRKDMYMDQETLKPNARFAECRSKMAKLAKIICDYAKSMAR